MKFKTTSISGTYWAEVTIDVNDDCYESPDRSYPIVNCEDLCNHIQARPSNRIGDMYLELELSSVTICKRYISSRNAMHRGVKIVSHLNECHWLGEQISSVRFHDLWRMNFIEFIEDLLNHLNQSSAIIYFHDSNGETEGVAIKAT